MVEVEPSQVSTRCLREKWATMSDSGNSGVTIDYVYHYAEVHGWKDRPGPKLVSGSQSPNNQPPDKLDFGTMSDDDLGIKPMKSFKKRRIEWDLKDRIPKHAYSLFAGAGKEGKPKS